METALGVVSDDHPGTPDSVWRPWRTALPELERAHWRRVVAVAPHPDDEVLGIGGLLHRLRRGGVSVTVLAVTDGTGAGVLADGQRDLAAVRRHESFLACAELGLAEPIPLGLVDTAVADEESRLVEELERFLTEGDICLASWRGDGHADHEASGRAAAAACARTGARLVEYPVWMWHWARPDDPRVPVSRARRVNLSPALQERKRRAVQHFASQLTVPPGGSAVITQSVLARLLGSEEVVLT
ncbi:PIG-L family deacetylase [Naumannella sp. ID2617S]|nr:PIG-L family deacetylase [Naumannella sp. ID2617S]